MPTPVAHTSLMDCHNNIQFYVDIASPRSLLPMFLFPDFHNGKKSCDLYTANNKSILQFCEMNLILQFDCFTNQKFVHAFILADISNPILGLDFLHKHYTNINTHSLTVTIDDAQNSV